jgi:trimethylamine--corrinoid protein Co-methyltransferase
MGGLLDALMAFDFAKAVIDNDIAMMVKRIRQGFEFSEENLALDLIAEVGPGGMFADTEHTLERMRATMYLTDIADRDPRQQWSEAGASDAQARAIQRVKEILTRDNPAVFSPDVDSRLRGEFIGMVAGDSTPPEGWKHSEAATGEDGKSSQRRRRRRHQRTTSN